MICSFPTTAKTLKSLQKPLSNYHPWSIRIRKKTSVTVHESLHFLQMVIYQIHMTLNVESPTCQLVIKEYIYF